MYLYIGILFSVSVFQMRKKPDGVDECIRDFILPLGRKHFSYGSNVSQMELLGVLMCESLMNALPRDEIEAQKYDLINNAFVVFFKVIVYWLQTGFKYVQSKGMS